MFFKNRNLSVLNYADGWTLWLYKNKEQTVESMQHKGFFNPVKDLMAVNDIIYIVGSDGVKQVYITTLDDVTVKEL